MKCTDCDASVLIRARRKRGRQSRQNYPLTQLRKFRRARYNLAARDWHDALLSVTPSLPFPIYRHRIGESNDCLTSVVLCILFSSGLYHRPRFIFQRIK